MALGRYSRPLLRKSPTSSFFWCRPRSPSCCPANAAHLRVDVGELRISVGNGCRLIGLAFLADVTRRIEQFGNQGTASPGDPAGAAAFGGQSAHTLAGHRNGVCGIPKRRRFDQRSRDPQPMSDPYYRRLVRPPDANPMRSFLRPFPQTPTQHGARRHAGCHRHRGQ